MDDLRTPEGVIELMKSSRSSDEWGENCDKVKKANGGYPGFWYEKIIRSGLSNEIGAKWGDPELGELKLILMKPGEDPFEGLRQKG